MRLIWLAGLTFIAGCTADSIVVGECGNHVVELGEDCDSRARPEHVDQGVTCAAPGTPNACRYTCDRATAAACPAGWQCGADQVCRHASGLFTEAPGRTPAVGDLALADIDGNGRREVVVTTLDDVHPLFSNGDGTFARGSTVPIVFPTPTPNLGDLDGDGRTDLITGTLTGFIQIDGDPSRAQLPYPQPAFDNTTLGVLRFPLRVAPASSNPQLPNHHLIALNQAGTFSVAVIDQLSYMPQFPATVLAADHELIDLAGVPTRGDVNHDGTDEFVVVFAGSDRVIVFRAVTTPSAQVTALEQEIVILPAAADHHGSRLVDVDGDGELDLVVGIEPSQVAVALGNGDGTFQPAFAAGFFDLLVGGAFPLASIRLAGGQLGWINDFGIFRDDLGSPTLVDFNNTFRWSEVIVADFNHDGLEDFAAAVADRAGLDVLLQTPEGLFAHTRVVTARAPSNLRVGDFDGDGTKDLVFRESAISNTGPYALSAAFGSAQGLIAPASLGAWDDIVTLEPMSIILAAAARDGVDDLVVQGAIGGSGKQSVTFLFGSYQRIMLAPYEARRGSPNPQPFAPQIAKIGRFTADAIPDVALISVRKSDGALEVAIAEGTGGGNLKIPAVVLAPLAPRESGPPTNPDAATILGFGCSTWLTADLDGNGLDDLVGMTHDGVACFGGRAGQVVVGLVTPDGVVMTQLESGDHAAARDVQVADVDGDGRPELLVVGDSRATVYFRSNEAFQAMDLPIDRGVPLGITVLNADADPELELAVATSTGVFVFDIADRQVASSWLAFAGDFTEHDRMFAADVDNDRIDDLLIHDTQLGELRVLLAVPHDAAP